MDGRIESLVALGGNLGDVPAAFCAAVDALLQHGASVRSRSALYKSAALCPPHGALQPPYTNAVVRLWLDAHVAPADWVHICHGLPAAVGRLHAGARGDWLPRELDVDVLAFGRVVVDRPEALLPHPGVPFRPFVLWPVCDVAADWRFGPHARSARDYLQRLVRPTAGVLARALSWRRPLWQDLTKK